MKRENKDRAVNIMNAIDKVQDRLKDTIAIGHTRYDLLKSDSTAGNLLSPEYYKTIATIKEISNLLITKALTKELQLLTEQLDEL